MPNLRSKTVRLAASLPQGDPTRRKLLAILKEAADFKVENVEFASGQEPDMFDDDFVTTVTVKFTLQGKLLAQLLGVQNRTLGKHLSKTNDRALLYKLQNSRIGAGILKLLHPGIKRMIYDYGMDEASARDFDSTPGVRIGPRDIDWDVDSSWQKVWNDSRREQVTFEVEVEVSGKWSQ